MRYVSSEEGLTEASSMLLMLLLVPSWLQLSDTLWKGMSLSAQEARSRSQPDDTSLSRWSPSSWLNTLLEKHAWFSTGLVWLPGASMSADVGAYDESPPNDSDAGPPLACLNNGKKVHMCQELPMQGIILSLVHLSYRTHGYMPHEPCL